MTDGITRYLADKFGLPVIAVQFLTLDWTVTEYQHFSVITRDNEVHVLLKGTFMPRNGFRDVFAPLIVRYGKAVTRCQRGDVESIYFIERIGFRRVCGDADILHYEIDHIPFQNRRPPCPSSYQ